MLKPATAGAPFPGVVGLHDHGGFKFLGKEKIALGRDDPPEYVVSWWEDSHPMAETRSSIWLKNLQRTRSPSATRFFIGQAPDSDRDDVGYGLKAIGVYLFRCVML